MLLTQFRRIRFNSRYLRNFTQAILLLGVGLSLLTIAGCATLPFGLGSPLSAAPINLTIRQVQATGQPGIYSIAGNASLPDQTRITVSAIRYLQDSAEIEASSSPAYSILDRQFADVSQGNWETNLNLWQVAPDGKFQEAWQLSQQDIQGELNPEPSVTFLATLDPANQPDNLRNQVENQDESVQAALARFTTEGELYLQASKLLTIALPTGSTTPPSVSPIRSVPAEEAPQAAVAPQSGTAEPESANWSRTNAPLTPDQLLR